jgi:2-phospho-L-lactate/phosphoenolpyruvate guanylyltransferase
MILIPVKDLATAKQRLSPVLDRAQRAELARAMLLDVLDSVAQCQNCPAVAVVTSDSFAVEHATRRGFEIIPDTQNQSETAAIEMATQICVSRGVESTLVIPADIPLMQSSELQKILQAAPEEGSVLVPAADSRGTNAAFRRPANLFPLRFGNDSFKPHFTAARETQKPCVVLLLPGIALDVDNPGDLKDLMAAPGDIRSQQLARQWHLAEFPLAANE